jgi:hypothetical protein
MNVGTCRKISGVRNQMRRGVFKAVRPFGGECNFASVEKYAASFMIGAVIAAGGKSM